MGKREWTTIFLIRTRNNMYIIAILNGESVLYLTKDKKEVDIIDEMCIMDTYSEANSKASRSLKQTKVISLKDILLTDFGKEITKDFCLTAFK